MLGAIAGDIIGSIYEFANFKEYDFPLFADESFFTDDSVLTVAVADALIHNLNIPKTLKAYALNYPNRGFGGSFYKWMHSDSLDPYNSWGTDGAYFHRVYYNNEADIRAPANSPVTTTTRKVSRAPKQLLCHFLARQKLK
jgi:hypothetical protein